MACSRSTMHTKGMNEWMDGCTIKFLYCHMIVFPWICKINSINRTNITELDEQTFLSAMSIHNTCTKAFINHEKLITRKPNQVPNGQAASYSKLSLKILTKHERNGVNLPLLTAEMLSGQLVSWVHSL